MLSRGTLRRYAARDGWLRPGYFNPPHVAHVSLRKPGIMGMLSRRGGRRLFLIEGLHRALRCLRERRPYVVYVLTSAETQRACLGQRRGVRQGRGPRAKSGRRTKALGRGGVPANIRYCSGRGAKIRARPSAT